MSTDRSEQIWTDADLEALVRYLPEGFFLKRTTLYRANAQPDVKEPVIQGPLDENYTGPYPRNRRVGTVVGDMDFLPFNDTPYWHIHQLELAGWHVKAGPEPRP